MSSRLEINEKRLEWHFSPADPFRIGLIGRNERGQVRAGHKLKTILLQRGIMAAMMADLIEYRAREQIVARYRLVSYFPLYVLPAQPIADLGVPDEQHDATGFQELERQHETRIVGPLVDLDGEIGTDAEPVIVDATPILIPHSAGIAAVKQSGGTLARDGIVRVGWRCCICIDWHLQNLGEREAFIRIERRGFVVPELTAAFAHSEGIVQGLGHGRHGWSIDPVHLARTVSDA